MASQFVTRNVAVALFVALLFAGSRAVAGSCTACDATYNDCVAALQPMQADSACTNVKQASYSNKGCCYSCMVAMAAAAARGGSNNAIANLVSQCLNSGCDPAKMPCLCALSTEHGDNLVNPMSRCNSCPNANCRCCVVYTYNPADQTSINDVDHKCFGTLASDYCALLAPTPTPTPTPTPQQYLCAGSPCFDDEVCVNGQCTSTEMTVYGNCVYDLPNGAEIAFLDYGESSHVIDDIKRCQCYNLATVQTLLETNVFSFNVPPSMVKFFAAPDCDASGAVERGK